MTRQTTLPAGVFELDALKEWMILGLLSVAIVIVTVMLVKWVVLYGRWRFYEIIGEKAAAAAGQLQQKELEPTPRRRGRE